MNYNSIRLSRHLDEYDNTLSIQRANILHEAVTVAKLPWKSVSDAEEALTYHEEAVAVAIKRNVGLHSRNFTTHCIRFLFDRSLTGQLKWTSLKSGSSVVEPLFEFGLPIYNVPAKLHPFLCKMIFGHYGQLTGYHGDMTSMRENFLKITGTPMPEENVKVKFQEKQTKVMGLYLKDRYTARQRRTLVSVI